MSVEIDMEKLVKLYTLQAKMLGTTAHYLGGRLHIETPNECIFGRYTLNINMCVYTNGTTSVNTYPGYHEEVFEIFLIEFANSKQVKLKDLL